MARTRNTLLAAVIKETGWSQEQLAAHVVRVATENHADELRAVTRSHIAMWTSGTRPQGRAPHILCETLSRRLGRRVTPAQIGLASETVTDEPGWSVDTATALADLGDATLDMNRRQILAASAYSAATAALPPETWWDQTLEAARSKRSLSRLTVTPAHVEAVREATRFYSHQDQRLGGRAGHSALVTFLKTDVASYVTARFPNEQVRRDLMTAAGELVYLAGWTAFDSSDHARAQKRFELALRMAAEADNAPLAGHILRAAAHQAVDLAHPRRALGLAEGSLTAGRYALASAREKSLVGVVHARALAATRRKQDALAALRRAEDDLRDAAPGDDEPERVFFFSEASLAHETACTLRDLGDLKGAEKEFKRSVRTRGRPFARTHAVTLGYLGDVQVRQGQVDAACVTWGRALETMNDIQSGRARDTVVQMRRALSPVRRRGSTAAELDERARDVLRRVS